MQFCPKQKLEAQSVLLRYLLFFLLGLNNFQQKSAVRLLMFSLCLSHSQGIGCLSFARCLRCLDYQWDIVLIAVIPAAESKPEQKSVASAPLNTSGENSVRAPVKHAFRTLLYIPGHHCVIRQSMTEERLPAYIPQKYKIQIQFFFKSCFSFGKKEKGKLMLLVTVLMVALVFKIVPFPLHLQRFPSTTPEDIKIKLQGS